MQFFVVDREFGVWADTICSVWDYERLLHIASTSNNYPNIFFRSDNMHISKMIVDKTVHNYALRSLKMGCIKLSDMLGNKSIGSKPHRLMCLYRYYVCIVI